MTETAEPMAVRRPRPARRERGRLMREVQPEDWRDGKRLEKPVKQLLLGAEPSVVASPGSLTDPAAFEALVTWSRSFTATHR